VKSYLLARQVFTSGQAVSREGFARSSFRGLLGGGVLLRGGPLERWLIGDFGVVFL